MAQGTAAIHVSRIQRRLGVASQRRYLSAKSITLILAAASDQDQLKINEAIERNAA